MILPAFKVSRILWSWAALSVVLAAGASGRDLLTNSPFVPEGYEPPQPRQERPPPPPRPEPPRGPQPLDRLEFRGLTKLGGKLAFSLFDPIEKRSFWIGIGQSEAGFSVVEFKEREDAVVVTHDGRTRTVALHESQVQVLPDTAAPAVRRTTATERPAEAVDPEERMQNLAEEIRRRREVRRALIEEAESRQGDSPPQNP